MKFVILIVFMLSSVLTSNALSQTNSEKNTLYKTVFNKSSFELIDLASVPAKVKEAVKQDFDATITKAYINIYEEYKLEIKNKDGIVRTVFANQNGAWIKPTNSSKKQ